jgi:hypothetical protein
MLQCIREFESHTFRHLTLDPLLKMAGQTKGNIGWDSGCFDLVWLSNVVPFVA